MTPGSIEAAVVAATESRRRSERGASDPRYHVYASSGHACPRQVALDLSNPENVDASFAEGSAVRLRYGVERERGIRRLLEDAAPFHDPPFEVSNFQSTVEVYESSVLSMTGPGFEPDPVLEHERVVVIRGKMELELYIRGQPPIVSEIKSGMAARAIRDVESGLGQHWGRHYLIQLGIYMACRSAPVGWLILDHPPSFRVVVVTWEEIRDVVAEFIEATKAAVRWRRQRGEIPPMLPRRDLCSRCPHNTVSCFPTLDFGEGVQMIFDDELEAAALERAVNESAHRRFERADKLVKDRTRGAELWVCGSVSGTGKWIAGNRVVLPDDVKAAHTVKDPRYQFRQTIVVDPEALRAYRFGPEDDGDG